MLCHLQYIYHIDQWGGEAWVLKKCRGERGVWHIGRHQQQHLQSTENAGDFSWLLYVPDKNEHVKELSWAGWEFVKGNVINNTRSRSEG